MKTKATPAPAQPEPAHAGALRLPLQTLSDAGAGVDPVHVIGACVQIAGQFASHLHLQQPVADLLRACAGELEAEAAANRTLQ